MPGVGAYIDSLQRSWTRRADGSSSGSVHVDVAGWRIRIDVTPASGANELGAAFDPARGPDRAPDLHVRVALGDPPPVPREPGWSEHDRLHYRDGRFEIHAAPDSPLSAIDHVAARAVCWLPRADLPYWERGAPMRALLAWFALRHASLLLHAAAVAEDGRAVLLVGSGGAGKTTTALGAWSDGMDYLGDDYVLVRTRPATTVARAYATAKVDSRTLTLLPSLTRHGASAPSDSHDDPPSRDKIVLRLAGERGLDVAEATIAAVVVPRVAPEARVRRVSAADALRAAVPSALFQLPCDRRVAFPLLADVVRRAPCFVLDTGPDPIRATSLVRGLVHVGDGVAS